MPLSLGFLAYQPLGFALSPSLWVHWLRQYRICLQCRRPGFSPWVGKILPEKAMATHTSILARRSPWTKEPGGLQSMGSQRVEHSWATYSFLFHEFTVQCSAFLRFFGWDQEINILKMLSHVEGILQEAAVSLDWLLWFTSSLFVSEPFLIIPTPFFTQRHRSSN